MNYKVVRNALGGTVCFGPNNEHYEPSLAAGEVLSIEAEVPNPPEPTQADINAEARSYLASTDWELLRELDGGQPMDAATKSARATARTKVVTP